MFFRIPLSILAIPIYTRYLTPADYGIMELLDLTSLLIAALIGSNFGHSLYYYYAEAKTEEGKAQCISAAYYGSLFLTALGVVVGLAARGRISTLVFGTERYADLFGLVFLTLAFSFPAEIGLSCLRALDRSRDFAIVSVARGILGTVLNVVLLTVAHAGLRGMLWSSLIVTGASAVYMAWYCRSWLRAQFNRPLIARLFLYAWPLGFSAVASLVLDLGDRYFLQRSVSLSDLGIYGLAYKFGMIVSLVSLVFNRYWKAQMFNVVQGPDGDRIYVKVCTYYVLILTVSAVGLGVVLPPVLKVIVGPAFASAAKYVGWIAIIYVFRGLGDYFRNVFFLSKKTGKDAVIMWAGALLCVAGYVVLIPWLKLWGAILATGISFVGMLVLSFVEAQRVRRFALDLGRLAWIVGSGVAVVAVFGLVQETHIVWQLLAGTGCVIAYVAVLLLFRVVYKEDEMRVRERLARFFVRRKPASAVGV
jgi:O-antigen/teichoic acid export membrane protein